MLARKLAKYLLLIADFLAINLALAILFWLHFHSGWFPESRGPWRSYVPFAQLGLLVSVAWLTFFFFRGLYRDWSLHSRALHVALVTRDISLFCLFLLAILTGTYALEAWKETRFLDIFTADRLVIVVSCWLTFVVLINGLRLVALGIVRALLVRGHGMGRLLILGATDAGKKIHKAVSSAPELGW